MQGIRQKYRIATQGTASTIEVCIKFRHSLPDCTDTSYVGLDLFKFQIDNYISRSTKWAET